MSKNGKDNGWSPDKVSDQLKRAEVEILRTGAKGYVMDGGFVFTTAGALEGGKPKEPFKKAHFETVRVTGTNHELLMAVRELVTDVAVLMYVNPEPPEAFETIRKSKTFLRLSTDPMKPPGTVVYVRKNETLVRALATDISDSMVRLIPDELLELGNSTTPIISECGELVALTSHFMTDTARNEIFGLAPRLYLALPFWVLHLMPNVMTSRQSTSN